MLNIKQDFYIEYIDIRYKSLPDTFFGLAQEVAPDFNGHNFDIIPRVQNIFYKALLPGLAPFSLVEALLKRFKLRGWFDECDLLLFASRAASLIEDIHKLVPPCVLFAVMKTYFNGWATSARFQQIEKVCRLCLDCDGVDSLEHYAACTFQWSVFASKLQRSVFPNSLARFFGLLAYNTNDRVLHAVHMYAVYSAYNSRKKSGIITGPDAMSAIIWQGHRTAQLHHKGLEKRYKDLWQVSSL